MAHNCVDWSTRPPTRKTPLLILTRGDDHVYAPVPKELKTLEEVARQEFDLGDVDVHFSSSCVSLCHGRPARITESAWEHLSPYIGCATVEVSHDRPTDERAKRKLPSDANDQGHENDRVASSARETLAVRDAQDTTSDHGNDRLGAVTPEEEEPWEEEVSAIPPPRLRVRRRVASEDEDEEGDKEELRSPLSPAASPPRPTQPDKEIKKERDSDYHAQSAAQQAEQRKLTSPVLRDNAGKPARESGNDMDIRSQTTILTQSYSETEYDTQTQTPVQTESGESDKVMIRVAHRPSKQESKFKAKGTTKVAKVLAGACRSFGLDASRASLYLIVSVEDEDGQVENLFPCDKSDTIARAGAERDTESRFLIKMTGEP